MAEEEQPPQEEEQPQEEQRPQSPKRPARKRRGVESAMKKTRMRRQAPRFQKGHAKRGGRAGGRTGH